MSQTQAERAVSAPEALGYVPAIDGMRALAVLSVMAFHLNGKALPGGFVGVDIFFVISGFVVTASIAHLKFDSVLSLQAEFYARRIARIMPPLLLCLLVTSAAYVLFVPRAWLSSQIVEVGLAAFFGVSNIVLPLQTDGYFMPRAEYNPFTHTWSLGVEEQFYLLFPPLMYLALGPRRDWRGPAVAAGVLSVLSLIACAWLTQSQSQHAFYSLASRYWELGLGMVLCLTAPLWRPWLGARAALRALVTLGAFAAIAVALIVPAPAAFPFPWALAPVLGSAALIAAAVSERGDVLLAGLRAAPVVYVGRISYALYLWHWPIYVLMRWTVGLEGVLNGAIAVAATFALAALTYRFVETPIRTWRSAHRTRPLAFVAVGLATTCLLALGTAGVLRAKDKFALTQTANIATWFPYPTLAPAPPDCTVDTAFRPVAGGHVEIWTPKGEGCGKPARPGILAVAGDSHADAYARLLRRYAYESGREVRIYTHAGCPVLFLLAGYRPQPHCAAFEDALAAEFEQTLTASDVLFLPSLRMARYGDQWGVFGAGDAAPSVSLTFVDGSEPGALLRRMTSSGAHALFAAPTPLFKAPTFRCSDWFNRMNPVCAPGFEIPKPELEARRAEAVTIMGRLAADNPRVSIWDPFPLLCPGPVCSAYRDGKPLVFDGDHLSGAANDLLYPHFAARMDAAFGEAKSD